MKLLKEQIKTKKFWLRCVFVLVLVVGIPILINESYKANKVLYTTVWGGEEVLSYYGTLLGAAATIVALVYTIRFTKKQIACEHRSQYERRKWEHIEELFEKAIVLAQPLTLDSMFMDGLSQKTFIGCVELQSNANEAWAAIDTIYGAVEDQDVSKIKSLLSKLKEVVKDKGDLSKKYSDLLLAYQSTVSNTDKTEGQIAMLMLIEQQKHINDAVTVLHDTKYKDLLKLKRNCFGSIYREIASTAQLNLSSEEGISWN